MNTSLKICVVSFLIIHLIVACTSNEPALSTVQVTQIEVPSSTATSDLVPSPVPTMTPTVFVGAPTPLPTFTTDNEKQVFSQFVQTNGGCKLPCILGLSPVYSNRTSVDMFVDYFQLHSQESKDQQDNLNIDSYRNGDYAGVGLVFWNNRIRVDVILDVALAEDEIEYLSLSTGVYRHTGEYANEAAEILARHSDYDEILGQFSLPEILQEYGKPTEIWVRPFPEDELHRSTYTTGSYPFDFVLIYRDQGFAVEYMARVIDEKDGYLKGCPVTAYTKIASWPPQINPEIGEIATFFEGTDSLDVSNYSLFKQIQNVTSLSVEDFFDLYTDPNQSECVMTPRDLWP